MKFYYNGKLMRTSKTHDYKFAVINENGKCHSCHGTREAAEKEWRKPIAECESGIAFDMKAIQTIKEGRRYVDTKICGRFARIDLKEKLWDGTDRSTVEYWEGRIEANRERIAYLKTRKIVELEARA